MSRGFARALLSKDVRGERKKLEKQATKRGMYGSIGSTLGTLAAGVILGPAAGVFATGIGTAFGSLLGGAAGSKFAGPIEGGQFFQGEREKIRGQTDPFGEERLTGALSAGVTAGMGQALKISEVASAAKAAAPTTSTVDELAKIGEEAGGQYGGFDFGGGLFGKDYEMNGDLWSKLRKRGLSVWD
jgi:hypothetical protein